MLCHSPIWFWDKINRCFVCIWNELKPISHLIKKIFCHMMTIHMIVVLLLLLLFSVSSQQSGLNPIWMTKFFPGAIRRTILQTQGALRSRGKGIVGNFVQLQVLLNCMDCFSCTAFISTQMMIINIKLSIRRERSLLN